MFLSGKSGRGVHGVGVIIHSSLLQSILAVKAISSWLIMVQIKITGGRFIIFGAYSPHDGTELSLREKSKRVARGRAEAPAVSSKSFC